VNESGAWGTDLDNFTSEVMYSFFLSKNATEIYRFDKLDANSQALVLAVLVLSCLKQIANGYMLTFNLLMTLAVYEITTKIRKSFVRQKKISVLELLTCYDEMWKEFKKINKTFGGMTVVCYLQMITWLSNRALDILGKTNWHKRLRSVLNYTCCVLTLYFAAEANQNVSTIKNNKNTIG